MYISNGNFKQKLLFEILQQYISRNLSCHGIVFPLHVVSNKTKKNSIDSKNIFILGVCFFFNITVHCVTVILIFSNCNVTLIS